MSMRGWRWKGLVVSLLVLAATAGVTLGVTTLLGVTFQGSGSAQQRGGSRFVEGGLQTANRDRLAICIQAVGSGPDLAEAGGGPALEVLGKARLEAALAEVRKHPRWELKDFGALPPLVEIGCPSGPPPVTEPAYLKPIESLLGHVVTEASYYLTFVFILPQQELDKLLGGSTQRVANQEGICGGDVCFPVSVALYVAPQELGDMPFLIDGLEQAIGLERIRR